VNALALLDSVGLTLAQLRAATEEVEEKKPRFTDVQSGPEMLRILALPRRKAPKVDCPVAAELAQFCTATLAKVPAPFPGTLRALQGAALSEMWQVRGLAGFIRAGGGKMLTSYLAPSVLRTGGSVLLIAPAQMRPDTAKMFKLYARDWHGYPLAEFPFRSYEELSQPAAGEELDAEGNVIRPGLLDLLRPSIVILDEAHKVQSLDNVARRRLERYKRANPSTIFIVLTATPFNTSIKDACHLLDWALGAGSPLPRAGNEHWNEREMWAQYLDPRQSQGPRVGVGALLNFLSPAELVAFDEATDTDEGLDRGDVQRKIVRRAIARWMYDTPGVISSQEGKLIDDDGREIGLEIMAQEPLRETPEVEEFFKHLRGDALEALREGRPREQLDEYDENGKQLLAYPGWRLPDGTEGEDGLWFAAQADKGGLGFWQRPCEPLADDGYVAARNQWAKWCRDMIKRNRRGIDSAARMEAAVRKGLYDDEGLLEHWVEMQRNYTATTGLKTPPTEPVWLSDEAIRAAEQWVREHSGVIWVRYTCLGERLAQELGLPFYRRGAKDAKTKRHIMEHRGGAAVVSIQSAKEGKNLQGLWSSNLWMAPPGEQSLARTHRAGQRAAVVRNWVYVGSYEHLASFYRGRDVKADFHSDLTLQDQKMVYAAGELPSLAELQARGTNRWTKSEL
jgi:hypothetical protein